MQNLNPFVFSCSSPPRRVWDKVISGSCKILVFVALEILLSYKIVLMGTNRPEGIVKFLCNVGKTAIIIIITVIIIIMMKNKLRSSNGWLFFWQIPQENTDAIVTKAIDLWHKYCGTPIHAV